MPKPRLHSVVEMDSWRPDGHVFLPVILLFWIFVFCFFGVCVLGALQRPLANQ